MKNKSILKFSVLAIMFAMVISSCKKTYSDPPEPANPTDLSSNITIKDLKAKHKVADGSYTLIDSNLVISGVVISSDKAGNIYKDLYIRGDDGYAIDVQLASTGLYVNYPVGRRVFLKCKGMYLTDYNGLISIGLKSNSNGIITVEGIPEPLIGKYLVGGKLGEDASPIVVTQADLTGLTMQSKLVGNLIQLKDYEFISGDTKRTFGDTTYYHTSTTKGFTHVKSCGSSTSYIISTSGYAEFVAAYPPNGNGSVTAICTIYGTTPQLVLRGLGDLNLTSPRCNLFEEDFGGYVTSTSCFADTTWQNIKESGDICYTIAAFGGSNFAKVSAFASAALPSTDIKTWLITPAINLAASTTPKFSYTCASRYTAGTLKALISTDYNGTSQTPSTATWVELNSIQANSTAFTAFIPYPSTGGYDLTAYAGKKVYIAFRYDAAAGTNKNAVATYEVNGIKISKN